MELNHCDSQMTDEGGMPGVLLQQALLSYVGDALIVTDPEFIITHWNSGAERIHGIPAHEALGRNGMTVLHYEYLDLTREEAILQARVQGTWKGRVRFRRYDDSEVILDVQVSRIDDEDGNCIGYIGINRDITELYQTRAILQNFTALLAALDETFILIDKQRKVVYSHFKQQASEFYGFIFSEGEHVLDRIPESRRELVADSCNRAFSGETVTYEVSSPQHPDTYIQVTYLPLKSETGAISHICKVVKDVSHQKAFECEQQHKRLAEDRLYQSRMVFEAFMEHSPMQAWITDVNLGMRYMNPAFLNRYNLPAPPMGQKAGDFLTEAAAQALATDALRVRSSGQFLATTRNTEMPDGSRTVERIYCFPIHLGDELLIGGWSADITEQARMQQQLVQLEKEKSKLVVRAIIETREEERRKITFALRHRLAPTLTVSRLLLESPEFQGPESERRRQYITETITQLNLITDRLNPDLVQETGFIAALYQAAEEGGVYIPLSIDLYDAEPHALTDAFARGVYRIIQSLCDISRSLVLQDVSLQLTRLGESFLVSLSCPQPLDLPRMLQKEEWRLIDNEVACLDGNIQVELNKIRLYLPHHIHPEN
jgi:PAS domain S-box-containing protein